MTMMKHMLIDLIRCSRYASAVDDIRQPLVQPGIPCSSAARPHVRLPSATVGMMLGVCGWLCTNDLHVSIHTKDYSLACHFYLLSYGLLSGCLSKIFCTRTRNYDTSRIPLSILALLAFCLTVYAVMCIVATMLLLEPYLTMT
jgi:hypothetical protein